MNKRILLIAATDDTYRKPLLETQGYEVRAVVPQEAEQNLASERYHLVLVATDANAPGVLDFCHKVKNFQPHTRVGLLMQRLEYIPPNNCVDAVFGNLHSPRKFLAAIRKLIDLSPGEKAMISDSEY